MGPTMNEDAETGSPLTRRLKTTDIEENKDLEIEASRVELANIVELLDLEALDDLRLQYRLRRGGGGRIHLTGKLAAHITQTCVVSLEPVQSVLDVPVDVEFWPAPLIEDLERKADDPSHAGLLDWPEPITNETIDLGPIVYETLATALDPYPKREGARFQWSEGKEAPEDRESGPFAALKELKRR